MKFKKGDKVKSKKYPFIRSEITNIRKDITSWIPKRILYITKDGNKYLAEELELESNNH